MRFFQLLCSLSVICLLNSCVEEPLPGKQVLITKGISSKVLDAYWLYLPKSYTEDKKWPMIMYLQGGDAAASSYPGTVKDGGPVYYMLRQQSETLPDSFVIVNPHMKPGPREDRQWYNNADGLIEIIDKAINENNVDPDRVYLTGLSRGGHGTWGVAKRYPEKFAAIVPIAGAITCQSNCQKIKDLPMWIVHNDGDPAVDYEYPMKAVSYFENELDQPFLKTTHLKDVNIEEAKSIFTTFDSDSHGGADKKLYTSPGFYRWLLSKPKRINR